MLGEYLDGTSRGRNDVMVYEEDIPGEFGSLGAKLQEALKGKRKK